MHIADTIVRNNLFLTLLCYYLKLDSTLLVFRRSKSTILKQVYMEIHVLPVVRGNTQLVLTKCSEKSYCTKQPLKAQVLLH